MTISTSAGSFDDPQSAAPALGGTQHLPVVDFARWSDPESRDGLADEVREICHSIGFFFLINHGIEGTFVDDVFATMGQLFDLPADQKARIDKRASPHFRGWEGEGSEYTNNKPDIREQVDLWSEHPVRPDGVEPGYVRLLGPNQWFADDVLPEFRPLLGTWFDRMGRLGDELMSILAVGLGREPEVFDRVFGNERMSLTKLIRYPPTPEGQAGVNAHHDAGFLTILAPGDTPGLQVQTETGQWIEVPPYPGAFVINLGEMLQAMTGNYFVAIPHRVVTAAVRYSAGYFHGPSLHTPLTPLDLDPAFAAAVAASHRHAAAGYMPRRQEAEAGVGAMESDHRPGTYGEQLWNYFGRSYPENMARHHAAANGDQS